MGVRTSSTVIDFVFQFFIILTYGRSCIFKGNIILFVLFQVVFCDETLRQVMMSDVFDDFGLLVRTCSHYHVLLTCMVLISIVHMLLLLFWFTYCWIEHHNFFSTPVLARLSVLRDTFSRLFGVISDSGGVYSELAISMPHWISAELVKILPCALKFFPFPQILISGSEFPRRGGYVRALFLVF